MISGTRSTASRSEVSASIHPDAVAANEYLNAQARKKRNGRVVMAGHVYLTPVKVQSNEKKSAGGIVLPELKKDQFAHGEVQFGLVIQASPCYQSRNTQQIIDIPEWPPASGQLVEYKVNNPHRGPNLEEIVLCTDVCAIYPSEADWPDYVKKTLKGG